MIRNRNRKGFSLIELIIVVAILGILVGIVVVNGAQFTRPAKIKTWNSSMQSLKEALMLSVSVTGSGSYPTGPALSTDVNAWLGTVNASKYLDKPITNPFWPRATVGIRTAAVAADVDQSSDPGTSLQAWLQYTTANITDIDGNTITNGKFTISWTMSGTAYSVSSSQ